VRFRLLPTDDGFFDLFNDAAANVVACTRQLRELLETAIPGGHVSIDSVIAFEHRGDELTRTIMRRLNTSFVTPFDREDIHELTVHLDDVLDGIQASAETMLIYKIDKPSEEVRQMVGILAGQAAQLLAALSKLEKPTGIATHLAMVHDLEHQADGLSRAAIGRLFETGNDPLEVIKLRDLYKSLEDTIDAAEDAAEVMERILAKS
jgi:predicted phosphate transport protein (TIGR00153 family)